MCRVSLVSPVDLSPVFEAKLVEAHLIAIRCLKDFSGIRSWLLIEPSESSTGSSLTCWVGLLMEVPTKPPVRVSWVKSVKSVNIGNRVSVRRLDPQGMAHNASGENTSEDCPAEVMCVRCKRCQPVSVASCGQRSGKPPFGHLDSLDSDLKKIRVAVLLVGWLQVPKKQTARAEGVHWKPCPGGGGGVAFLRFSALKSWSICPDALQFSVTQKRYLPASTCFAFLPLVLFTTPMCNSNASGFVDKERTPVDSRKMVQSLTALHQAKCTDDQVPGRK